MAEHNRLWHVILTVGGREYHAAVVRAALSRLGEERPFLHSIRYRGTMAELQYWEESADVVDAASLALRLWREHRFSCGLPDWEVTGLEVVERDTFNRRGTAAAAVAVGLPGARPQPF